jgi:hypothetical protein
VIRGGQIFSVFKDDPYVMDNTDPDRDERFIAFPCQDLSCSSVIGNGLAEALRDRVFYKTGAFSIVSRARRGDDSARVRR